MILMNVGSDNDYVCDDGGGGGDGVMRGIHSRDGNVHGDDNGLVMVLVVVFPAVTV